ncbi:MAG: hypothetical protein V7L29_19150 [Nostoc sp.]
MIAADELLAHTGYVAIANRMIELSSFRQCLRLATPTQYLQQLV